LVTKSFYYKEIQKEKKETGKVERALAIPDGPNFWEISTSSIAGFLLEIHDLYSNA